VESLSGAPKRFGLILVFEVGNHVDPLEFGLEYIGVENGSGAIVRFEKSS